MRALVLALGALLAAGCARHRSPRPHPSPLVASRPYVLRAPAKHETKAPLVVLLHGFGGDHAQIEAALGADALADAHGFYLALPDGTLDPNGHRFWNASDACCDFHALGVDDVAYLDALIDDALARQPIDRARVYVAGFSNGGFMAHRYACERAERVAAVASFAGDPWKDPSRCAPRVPVSVLQIHGDADEVVHYGGGMAYDSPAFHTPEFADAGAFPAVRDGVAMWARLDGCGAPVVTDAAREEVLRYAPCAKGTEVQLWTRHGAPHYIGLGSHDMERVWSFLSAHTRR